MFSNKVHIIHKYSAKIGKNGSFYGRYDAKIGRYSSFNGKYAAKMRKNEPT